MNKSNLYRYTALAAFMLSYTVLMAVGGTHGDRLKGLVQEPRGTVYERIYQYLHEPREFKEVRTVIRTLSQIVQRAPLGCARGFNVQSGSDLESRAHDCYDHLFSAIFNLYSYFHTHPAPRSPTAEYQQLVVKFFTRVKEAAAVVDEYEHVLSLRQPGNGSPLQGATGQTEASHLDAFVSKLSSSANGKPLAVVKNGPSWLTAENGAYALGGLIGCYLACWVLSTYIERRVTTLLDERAQGSPSAELMQRVIVLENAMAGIDGHLSPTLDAVRQLDQRLESIHQRVMATPGHRMSQSATGPARRPLPKVATSAQSSVQGATVQFGAGPVIPLAHIGAGRAAPGAVTTDGRRGATTAPGAGVGLPTSASGLTLTAQTRGGFESAVARARDVSSDSDND